MLGLQCHHILLSLYPCVVIHLQRLLNLKHAFQRRKMSLHLNRDNTLNLPALNANNRQYTAPNLNEANIKSNKLHH